MMHKSNAINRSTRWIALHALVWLLAAWVAWFSMQSLAPQPAWDTHPVEGPSILVQGGKPPLAALRTPDGVNHSITPQWHGLPPHVQPTLADKHQFEALEDWLLTLRGNPRLHWLTKDGRLWPIIWAEAGAAGLPTISWVLLISGLITWHLAIWNLSMRPRDTNTRLYALAGIAFTVGNLIRAWLSARPWALPSQAWDFQFWVSHFCGLCFLGCLLLMVLRIPQAAIKPKTQLTVAGIIFAVWVADMVHLVPNSLSATYHQPMAALALLVLVTQSWMAWQHRNDTAYWAALRWFLIVFLMAVLPPGVLYGAWAVGLVGDGLYDPILVAPALGYCALSALLHRNRLIQLESWRSRATSVWVAGVITLGLMTSLVVRNDQHLWNTLGISLLALPWIYLLVRSILTYRTPASAAERLQALMGDIMDMAVTRATRDDTTKQWINTLLKAFEPRSIEVLRHQPQIIDAVQLEPRVRIVDNGMSMQVPHLDGQTLVLTHASARLTDQSRTRPFTPTDAELATAMWRLTSHGLMSSESYQQGIKRERQRIASDLHDTIGGRLLHLSQTATNVHQRQYAISTLADLRSITRGLSRDSSLWANVLADLRHQLDRELDAIQVELQWRNKWPDKFQSMTAMAEDAVAISCIISELLRNALEHAQAKHIQLHWHPHPDTGPIDSAHMAVEMIHDCPHGNVPPVAHWSLGLGVNSIKRRIDLLGGHCAWTVLSDGPQQLRFTAHWPLRQTPAT